jgi:hypothetical protein
MSAVTTVAAMKTFLVISDKCTVALIHSAGEVMHRNGSQNSIIPASLTMEIQTSEDVMVEVLQNFLFTQHAQSKGTQE